MLTVLQYKMKNYLIFIFSLLSATSVVAQERETYQTDSLYKANNVKLRKWYSGTNKKLGLITYYDKEGRMTKYQVEMNMGATTRTTHYTYDKNGKLTHMVDSTKNGEPDKKEIKRLKKMGINANMLLGNIKNKPPLEVSRYELIYQEDELVKLTKYNPDGSLDIVDHLKENGKIQKREWYRNGELYQISTTEYVRPNLKEKYYGWEIRGGQKSEWNYTFKYDFEAGRVKRYIRFDNGEQKETVKYCYDGNGLLLKTEGYVVEQFEYEFYK